jgi:hypothetical protein
MISGFSRWLVIFPVTHTLAFLYFVSGVPNFVRSLPQIKIVKTSLGYGSSRFKKVGRLTSGSGLESYGHC